jgi:hypothetical protein
MRLMQRRNSPGFYRKQKGKITTKLHIRLQPLRTKRLFPRLRVAGVSMVLQGDGWLQVTASRTLIPYCAGGRWRWRNGLRLTRAESWVRGGVRRRGRDRVSVDGEARSPEGRARPLTCMWPLRRSAAVEKARTSGQPVRRNCKPGSARGVR